jgi:hypothetical protein
MEATATMGTLHEQYHVHFGDRLHKLEILVSQLDFETAQIYCDELLESIKN